MDTILLGSAVALAWQINVSPLNTPWLAVKLITVLLYISIGFVAFKYGRTKNIRLAAWLAAQGIFFYIVSVAVTHSPFPWSVLQ